MERRIESDVEGWPTRPFEDGYEGLRQLAAADFSGVVRAAGTWLFFVNGNVVDTLEGSLEDVEDAQGTAHKAPHPSLPLLYAMQATGGDTRAKYYTNDTPISEVDDTLSSGSFTGYLELSENVLSGDYYQLYHGGRSMSVAFVGNSGKMVTGEEAFDRADDEVGIYEVVDVDVDVTDVPEPEGSDPENAGPDREGTGAASERAESESLDATGPAPAAAATDDVDDTAESDPDADSGPDPVANDATRGRSGEKAGDDTGDVEAEEAPDSTTAGAAAATAASADDDSASGSTDDGSPNGGSTAGDDAPIEAEPVPDGSADDARPGDEAADTPAASGGSSTEQRGTRRRSEAAWQEATTVPSLDPDRSEDDVSGTQSGGKSGQRRRSRSKRQSRQQRSQQSRTQSSQQSSTRSSDPSRSASPQREAPSERSPDERSTSGRSGGVDDTLDQEILEREDRLDRLQQRVENLQDERDEVMEERDELAERVESLTGENESLRGEIRELEQEIEELEAAAASTESTGSSGTGSSGDVAGGGAMAPRAALEGTDLFVRYGSKSAPTLEAAHDGSADATAVNENLGLDVHTQFEDEGVTVDGEPFPTFLRETMAYRFVEWLVRELPYEIRETGSASALRDLYDAIPEIDRVEFHGEVARDAIEDEEGSPSETFDVVVRDKMGEALLVANMNDARDPATGRMIVDLQEAASRVKEHSMALSGTFFVTRSFFEPAALETTSEATSGSLLSRDSRASYVKLSRKQGYHLCLVEARGDDLHLNVPEL